MPKRRVGELMNPDVVCLSPKTSVRDAARLLGERGVSGAPVVDEAGALLGVVTQNDLARFAARRLTVDQTGAFFTDEPEYADLRSTPADHLRTPVERVMSVPVYTVSRDAGVAVAANILRERRVHRLVVTERGRLVGMLSTLDLMRVVEELG